MKPRRPPGIRSSGAVAAVAGGARQVAVVVLQEWSEGRGHAADLIDRAARHRGLSGPDRAMLQDLVLTVLRNQTLLDRWTRELTGERVLDELTQLLIRLGLVQLLILRMAEHAAVHETVALARRSGGLVNAVLRRACRERVQLLRMAEQLPLAERYSHPPFLVKRWLARWGEARVRELLEWNQQPSLVHVRRNGLMADSVALHEVEGLTEVGEGFYRCDRLPLESLQMGHCYAQDPSTAMAPRLLNPQPGERVLDACAAPGGKAAIMAELMRNEGDLVAVDLAGHRLQRLEENLRRLGVTQAKIEAVDWASADPLTGATAEGGFDRILLDVPCSNTGVMGRRVDVRWRLTEAELDRMVGLQRKLVARCLPLLREGGFLAYSTCSIDQAENEDQVAHLVATHPHLQLIEQRLLVPPYPPSDGAFAALLQKVSR